MDILKHNRQAWNRESANNGEWSIPVSSETIRQARQGHWEVILTPIKTVPKSWFGELADKKVLCLASGGGQQAPVLAAAGAKVTSFDLSDVQLQKDRQVAEKHDLSLECVQGDMADLTEFEDQYFDLIFHPTSNVFVPDVCKVWQECHRVVRPGGALLSGIMNPSFFLFDHDASARDGEIKVKYKQPYREPESLDSAGLDELKETGRALEFGHSLELQIGGQLSAGFVITDLYEDYWSDDIPLNAYSPSYIATKAIKPDAN